MADGTADETMFDEVTACTLPTAERPVRVAEFTDLFAGLRAVDRRDPRWLRLRLPGAEAARARDLTARESRCCAFFDFRIDHDGPDVLVDVRVPDAHVDVLDGLERLARATR
ncbi:MAG TPA: hypothetical protein VEZ42_18235 [Pseudonocardia sp.]|nr:hypothetical protein [Pseudonocardia sp.]